MYALCFVVCLIVGFFCAYFFLRRPEHRFLKAKSETKFVEAKLVQLLADEKKLRQLIQLSD